MPFIRKSTYQAPLLFKNSYVNTIYPAVFRKFSEFQFTRERIETLDDDFLDLDWSQVGSRNLVIVLHGLEGSSDSQYARGIARYFNGQKWDALAINHRGCSGENNRQAHSYHMGATADISYIIEYVEANYDYESIVLVGFSLGGNVTLKYVGEQGDNLPKIVKAAAAFSVPIEIPTANKQISRPKNAMYMKRFINSMINKAQEKMDRDDCDFPVFENFNPKNFNEFDEMLTAPVHGFKSAQEYWEKSSSLQFIPNIKIPTLLVNAQDDTFLSKECYPIELSEAHPHFHFEMPKYGGHCGFYERDKEGFVWFEKRAFEFVSEVVLRG